MSQSKTTKRARNVAQQNRQVERDDGSRWQLRFTHEHPVTWLRGQNAYIGEGMPKDEAQRYARSLEDPVELVCVKEPD